MLTKLICTSILFLSSFTFLTAENEELLAKSSMLKAEGAFNNHKYNECIAYLEEATKHYGKTNSDIQYLKVKSLMAICAQDKYNKIVLEQADKELKTFFQITLQDSFMTEKYYEMIMAFGKIKVLIDESKKETFRPDHKSPVGYSVPN